MSTFIKTFVAVCVATLLTTIALAQHPADKAPKSVAIADSDEDPGIGAGGGAHHIFPGGQCTRCAADTYRDRTGKNVTWRGNATDWLVNAKAAGFKTSTSQALMVRNAIIVFGPGKFKNGTPNPYGHVSIIDRLTSDSVTVTECNWSIPLGKSSRSIKLKDLSAQHFKGVILP
jgi:surface antigen